MLHKLAHAIATCTIFLVPVSSVAADIGLSRDYNSDNGCDRTALSDTSSRLDDGQARCYTKNPHESSYPSQHSSEHGISTNIASLISLSEYRSDSQEPLRSSPVTVLSGDVELLSGATQYLGNSANKSLEAGVSSEGYVNPSPQNSTSLNYRLTLDISTTFTGTDLLFLQLRSGNFQNSAFAGYNSYVFEAAQTVSLDADTSNRLHVSRLWYQKPIVPLNAMIFVGTRIRNTDMLAVPPSVYGDGDDTLQIFKQAGIPGAYTYDSGAGAGFWFKRALNNDGLILSWSNNYVAFTGNKGDPGLGGLGTSSSRSKYLSQVAFGTSMWQLSFAYAYTQARGLIGVGTPLGGYWVMPLSNAHTLGTSAFWQPMKLGWIPSISAGIGSSWFDTSQLQGAANHHIVARKQNMSWMAGLEWQDLGGPGNILGLAIGGPEWVVRQTGSKEPNDTNMAYELWYKILVSDFVSIVPSVFYLSRPFGQLTGAGPRYGGSGTSTFSVVGAVLKFNFSF